MAVEQIVECITATAAADLSAKQFYLVKLDTTGKAALCTGVTDNPVGVLQNEPTSGQPASIAYSGRSKFIGGGSVAIDAFVGSDGDGKGTALTLDAAGTVYNYAIGRVIEQPTAANEIGAIVLFPGGLPVLV